MKQLARFNPKRIRIRRRDFAFFCIGILVASGIGWLASLIGSLQTPVAYRAQPVQTAWIPPTVTRWQQPLLQAAKTYNIDPSVLGIIMTLESGGYTKADSGQAQGLMQITPATAKEIAQKHLKQPRNTYNIYDPATNIEFGAAYLAYLRDEFCDSRYRPTDWNGCIELIAAGYNGGPGAANALYKGQGLTDTQTVIYSRDAFNMWRERRAAASPTYDRWRERGGQDLIDKAVAEQKNR